MPRRDRVAGLHVRAAAHELARGQAGKSDKIANEMRLIEVAAPRGQRRPAGRWAASRQSQGALEPLQAAEDLRRDAHLLPEELDEAATAEVDLSSHLADAN